MLNQSDPKRFVRLSRVAIVVPFSSERLDIYMGTQVIRLRSGRDLFPFVRAIISGASEKQLVASYGSLARRCIAALTQIGALIDFVPGQTDWSSWDRELSYFSDAKKIDPEAAIHRLRSSTVVLFGVGSLGSWTLQHLVASGVGRVELIDGDEVDETNLSRQTLFHPRDVGEAKVDAARDRVVPNFDGFCANAHRVRVTSTHDLEDVLVGLNAPVLLIQTADEPAWKCAIWSAHAAKTAGVPLLRGNRWFVRPVVRIGLNACPGCEWKHATDADPSHAEVVRGRAALGKVPSAAISTRVSISGAILAHVAIAHLAGFDPLGEEPVIGDVATNVVASPEPDIRHPDCPVCGRVDHEWEPY